MNNLAHQPGTDDFSKRLQIGGAVIALLMISMVATFHVKPLAHKDLKKTPVSVKSQVVDMAAFTGRGANVDTSSPKRVAKVSKVEGSLNLQSVGRDYTYVFSGKVDCKKACSTTHIRISLLSTSDTQIERTVDIAADGSYSLPLQVRESEGDQIDWRLTVEQPKSRKEFTGRTILMDHPTIEISHSIQIG